MSETAFEKWLDNISDGLGPDLPARPEDIARTAWNAALDATLAQLAEIDESKKGTNYEFIYRDCLVIGQRQIQKLRSE